MPLEWSSRYLPRKKIGFLGLKWRHQHIIDKVRPFLGPIFPKRRLWRVLRTFDIKLRLGGKEPIPSNQSQVYLPANNRLRFQQGWAHHLRKSFQGASEPTKPYPSSHRRKAIHLSPWGMWTQVQSHWESKWSWATPLQRETLWM